MEKLKENFKKECEDWDTEKAALAKKAEDTEAALKLVVEELTGLKRHINAMTSVVFGKRPHLMFFQVTFSLSSADLLMLTMSQGPVLPIWALICG